MGGRSGYRDEGRSVLLQFFPLLKFLTFKQFPVSDFSNLANGLTVVTKYWLREKRSNYIIAPMFIAGGGLMVKIQDKCLSRSIKP